MKNLIIIIVLFVVQVGQSQKLTKKDYLKIEKDVYHKALNNYDLDAAKNAIYQIIAVEGEQSEYMDSLAFVYFNQQNYLSCLKVSEEILQKEEKLPILELKAVSLENLNAVKEAITAYEKIFAKKKEPYIAYKLASLQQKIKRSAEAYTTLKSVENGKFPEKASIVFPTAKKGETQQVPLQAAYYHLIAMSSYDLHNYDLAIQYFDKALQIYPDFFVAKQNKQAIELMKQKLNANPQETNKTNK